VPTHRQPATARFHPPALPRTERLVEEILTLPMSASHTGAEVDAVVAAVRDFFAR
jgi:dTDP-4-amino-4,6-dideoxygalactose transaminase